MQSANDKNLDYAIYSTKNEQKSQKMHMTSLEYYTAAQSQPVFLQFFKLSNLGLEHNVRSVRGDMDIPRGHILQLFNVFLI